MSLRTTCSAKLLIHFIGVKSLILVLASTNALMWFRNLLNALGLMEHDISSPVSLSPHVPFRARPSAIAAAFPVPAHPSLSSTPSLA